MDKGDSSCKENGEMSKSGADPDFTKSGILCSEKKAESDLAAYDSSIPSTSTGVQSSHSIRRNLLCEEFATDSCNEEDEEDLDKVGTFSAKCVNTTRKRRILQQRNKANQISSGVVSIRRFLLPLDVEGHLDTQTIFGDDFDSEQSLSKALAKSLTTSSQTDLDGKEAKVEQESVAGGDRTEFDPETFTLKSVVKKLKEEAAGDNGEDERPPDFVDLGVVARKKGNAAAGRGRIDVERGNEEGQDEGKDFKLPKLRNRKFIFKPLLRGKEGTLALKESDSPVAVVIPEQLAASYGLYIWPSSPVLSWYVWFHREDFVGKHVLELGAGTSLPGLLCAKVGAAKVFLSDIATDDNVLENCRQAVKINDLSERIQVVGVTWGMFEPDTNIICEKLDYIIGSDLFFDPSAFEQLCVTISFLLNVNTAAQVLITVQERSDDWSIEEYLLKWGLHARIIHTRQFLSGSGIQEDDLDSGNTPHSIYILEVTKRN